ncbi:hypothetical protein DFQ27_001767 [Actinomortierella ambigua]|uniref:CREG-like beta-barrel domain-containing protein n=1 Tax=Actinomortierella ambigua TaxID=1343610 RepID=A0A9P6U807_9FUNG|nr:hypothetical protein DFQ26_001580 [Actinomortierella ambigua]KAG0263438.1 hypothetical protein DFQ27_001767 [Actinomortierella ambigua]
MLCKTFLVALSVTLGAVLAAPFPSDFQSDVTGMEETVKDAAVFARRLIKNTGVGTLVSVMNEKYQGGSLEGYPFGSMDYFSEDCEHHGRPLMLLSRLQINVQNARTDNRLALAVRRLPGPGERGNPMTDPRVTMMGHLAPLGKQHHEMAVQCFTAKHPDARWWLPESGFHDFEWYTFEIDSIYYIGGFGGIHYIGWIPVDTYYAADDSVVAATAGKKDCHMRERKQPSEKLTLQW